MGITPGAGSKEAVVGYATPTPGPPYSRLNASKSTVTRHRIVFIFQSELLTLGTENFLDAKVNMVLLKTSQFAHDMI
jgi:hypothetical protein